MFLVWFELILMGGVRFKTTSFACGCLIVPESLREESLVFPFNCPGLLLTMIWPQGPGCRWTLFSPWGPVWGGELVASFRVSCFPCVLVLLVLSSFCCSESFGFPSKVWIHIINFCKILLWDLDRDRLTLWVELQSTIRLTVLGPWTSSGFLNVKPNSRCCPWI